MRNTSSISTWISPDWTIDTSLRSQIDVPTPVLSSSYYLKQFDSVGILNLIESSTEEEADDILSAEKTLVNLKTSPQDISSYREYREKRGL